MGFGNERWNGLGTITCSGVGVGLQAAGPAFTFK